MAQEPAPFDVISDSHEKVRIVRVANSELLSGSVIPAQTSIPAHPNPHLTQLEEIVNETEVLPAHLGQPLWNDDLRLVGISSIDDHQTAYFSVPWGTSILAL